MKSTFDTEFKDDIVISTEKAENISNSKGRNTGEKKFSISRDSAVNNQHMVMILNLDLKDSLITIFGGG